MAKDGEPVVRLESPGSHDKPAQPEAEVPEPEAKPAEDEKPAAKKATASKARA